MAVVVIILLAQSSRLFTKLGAAPSPSIISVQARRSPEHLPLLPDILKKGDVNLKNNNTVKPYEWHATSWRILDAVRCRRLLEANGVVQIGQLDVLADGLLRVVTERFHPPFVAVEILEAPRRSWRRENVTSFVSNAPNQPTYRVSRNPSRRSTRWVIRPKGSFSGIAVGWNERRNLDSLPLPSDPRCRLGTAGWCSYLRKSLPRFG